jgi:hypothetical protein
MKKQTQAIFLPPRGWKKELAKLTDSCEKTVYNAIRQNSKGVKADKIRALFRAKYINPNT